MESTLGVVLCGGRSRRFGAPKWEAVLDGRRLLDHVVGCQRKAFGDVVIVAASDFSAETQGARLVLDEFQESGPASGVHAALGEAARLGLRGIWCLPCDAPFARPELGVRLAEMASPDVDAVFPESRGPLGFEPLFGWYGVQARETIDRLLTQAAPSMATVARSIGKTELLPFNEVEAIAPAHLQFLNINTPEDMAAAQRHLPTDRR